MKEKYVLFGKGIVFDIENKKIIVSENASSEDIKLAIEYIEKNIEKI